MRNVLLSLVLVLAASPTAEAKIKIVTTIQTFKVIAEQLGQGHVEVTALVGDSVDPHRVDPRPSYALLLNKADLLVHVGLDLEAAWLPPLIQQARNPRIQTGQTGNLDASTTGIAVRDVGTATSRAQGDIHPQGNPHYWLAPDNALKVARAITARLHALDSSHGAAYEQGLLEFQRNLEDKRGAWTRAAQTLAGSPVVTYHKSWSYLTSWLGLREIGYIEPKPGVPPAPAHLASLTREAKKQGARMVIVESYYPRNTAQRVAELGGMRLVVLPSDAGGKFKTYAALLDHVVSELASALK